MKQEMTNDTPSLSARKSIAIVSGKGGSGKTMVAATLTQLIDEQGRVLLIDADFGTAGLSYYLGLSTVPNISIGLTNILDHSSSVNVEALAQPMSGFGKSRFIAVGDHRGYLERTEAFDATSKLIATIVESKQLKEEIVIVDCRGGIDADSLAVCQAVDTILIVAETDTTSFQATQHLVEVLTRHNLSQKLGGFIINKVFDDPSTIARAGTASFKCQYLGSIPFDLEATKRFLVGEIPSRGGMFTAQVWHAAFKLLPEIVRRPPIAQLSFDDFRNLSIRDNNSVMGGMVLSLLSLGAGSVLLLQNLGLTQLSQIEDAVLLQLLVATAVVTGIEPIRRIFGRAFALYSAALTRVFRGRR